MQVSDQNDVVLPNVGKHVDPRSPVTPHGQHPVASVSAQLYELRLQWMPGHLSRNADLHFATVHNRRVQNVVARYCNGVKDGLSLVCPGELIAISNKPAGETKRRRQS